MNIGGDRFDSNEKLRRNLRGKVILNKEKLKYIKASPQTKLFYLKNIHV